MPSDSVSGLWAAAANDLWAAGNGGKLLHFDGTGWTVTMTGAVGPPDGRNAFFPGIWGSSSDDV